MKYKVVINTDAYECQKCSKKHWEPGTINDYMLTINGWHTVEYSLQQVIWRIMMLRGDEWPSDEWCDNPNTATGLSDRYTRWRNKRCNTVKFYDRLCEISRQQMPSVYGWAQGYLDIDKAIEELRETGKVRINFSDCYDIRQSNYKKVTGCYMEITKAA